MQNLATPLCRRLGIAHPIVQAPMGGSVGPALAAAVAQAGGLGMLALSWSDLASARDQIRETRRRTSRPFGVNLVLDSPQDDRLAIVLDEGVRIVSLFWGDPGPYIARVHERGGIVLHTVGSADEARRSVSLGVDAIVAQGWEAGGHVWGEVATFALVPAVADAVAPVPVIAAGGIADGRGLAAVLALGAQAAWIGTRFLCAEESEAHPRYRELILAAAESSTVHTKLFDVGWPDAAHRVIRNATHDAWEAAGRPASGARPGEGETVARAADGEAIPRYSADAPKAGMTGDLDAMCLYAGQGVGLVRDIRPAAAIVAAIVAEAESVLRRLGAP
jgi:nitronate monooxygenase